MSDHLFHEPHCAIGGCACPHWDAWWLARREHAGATAEGRALDAIADDTAYSEGLDALAEGIPDAEVPFRAPPCAQPGCRHGQTATHRQAET